tara:strand:- start:885 stop:1856 length:972 start_codon:yes stop_codon:yes gene_type:complete
MGKFYKGIEYVSNPREQIVFYKNQTFFNTDDGVKAIHYRSESLNWNDSPGQVSHTISGSHYNFVHYFLHDSCSFEGYGGKLHKNKLYSSGSVIYIPQQYFGEKIKPGSFTLTDNSTSQEIIIKDDKHGNLYSSNAKFSQSVNHASSSENYVGNLHYETGVAMITETGSWSGSVGGNGLSDINYTEVGGGSFRINFNSTFTITQNEIILKVKPHEFNATANGTIFQGKSSNLLPEISRSIEDFKPYATTIAFYNEKPSVLYQKSIQLDSGADVISQSLDPSLEYMEDNVEYYLPETKALLVAKFPKPLKMSDKDEITIIIRYDT